MKSAKINLAKLAFGCSDRCYLLFAFEALVLFGLISHILLHQFFNIFLLLLFLLLLDFILFFSLFLLSLRLLNLLLYRFLFLCLFLLWLFLLFWRWFSHKLFHILGKLIGSSRILLTLHLPVFILQLFFILLFLEGNLLFKMLSFYLSVFFSHLLRSELPPNFNKLFIRTSFMA